MKEWMVKNFSGTTRAGKERAMWNGVKSHVASNDFAM